MERFISIILLSTFLFHGTSVAQFTHKMDSLWAIYNKAASDSDKVVAYGKLAEYYYIYQLDKEGDSILQAQLKVAEISQNKNLILIAFFGKAIMRSI